MVLARMWRNQNLSKLLVGIKCYHHDGNSRVVLPEVTQDPAIPGRGAETRKTYTHMRQAHGRSWQRHSQATVRCGTPTEAQCSAWRRSATAQQECALTASHEAKEPDARPRAV